MSVSESSSTNPFPHYRVKRKPPPTIDPTEKYPSPDPHDPFAPLWVLRNRTSSALGQNPLATRDSPSPFSQPPAHTHQAHRTGKSDTSKTNSVLSSIPIERRRSNSYLSPHSTTTYGIPPRSTSTVPQSSNNGPRLPSQPASATTGGGVSHPPMKPAPVNSDNTQRSNAISRTSVHPQPRAPGNITRRPTVDMRTPDNSSGNETESDLSVPHRKPWVDLKVKSIDVESQGKTNNPGLTTTISFNLGLDVKPALLRRATSNGTTSTGSASLARNVPPISPQSRLAKFWLPKKASHDGYMADGEKRNIKSGSRPNQKGPVHKLSISAPLKDSFVHGRSKSQSKDDDNTITSSARNPGRSRGGYTSDTDFEEGTGGARLRGVLFRTRKRASTEDTPVSNSTPDAVIPEPADLVKRSDPADDKETEKRRSEMSWAAVNMDEYYTPVTSPRASYPTPAPSPQLKPALELVPEAPLGEEKAKEGKPKKASHEPQVEEKNTRTEIGKKGFTTGMKEQRETIAMSRDADRAKAQGPRASNLKAAKTSASATTAAYSASGPPSINSSIPPPPPKLFKRRISSSAPAPVIVDSATSSSNDRGQLPSTHSISNTSIVHVSFIPRPKPSEAPLNKNEDAGEFEKSSRAPRTRLGVVEGVQSEPEPLRARSDDLRKGSKEDKKQTRKGGGEAAPPLKGNPKTDNEGHASPKETKVPEANTKPSSRPPISFAKHVKAASTDFGTRKDKSVLVGVGRPEGSNDGVSKKATVPVSISTPARLFSKEHEEGCLPQLQPEASRSIFHSKGASADTSFGVPATEYSLPTRTQISQAASLPVYAEDGRKCLFGSLYENQKTAVIFIRHFWCPLCQDYMSVVKSAVTPDMIVADGWMKAGDEDEVVWKNEKRRGGSKSSEAEKIGFVVISNGAHGMIAKYRQIFSLPFRVYTDPSLAIYKVLGMGKTGMDCQEPQHCQPTHYLSDLPAPSVPKKKKHSYSLRKKADTSISSLSDKEREQGGGYVKRGFMGGIAMVVARAIKVGMPVWEKGGDVGQLGGEFVLGPGLLCTYAHRMQSSKGHAPIEEVLQAAGVKLRNTDLPPRPSSPEPALAQKQTDSVDLSSPPKPTTKTRHPQEPVRNRKDSLKHLQETVPSSRSSTAVKSISHPLPRGPSQRGERDRRNDQSPDSIPTLVTSQKIVPPALPPALKAVMTREEETRWEEARQKSIEKAIQDRGKNVRRVGALGRSPSSQGQSQGGGVSARSTTTTTKDSGGGGYVSAKEDRGNAMMTESRSAPTRAFEEEERIVYKAEGRRVQGYDAHHGPTGSGYVKRVSTSRVGHSATSSSRR